MVFGFISYHSILVSARLSINNGFHHRLGMHSSGKCKYLPPPASAQVTAPTLPLVDTLFAGSTNGRAAVPNTGPPCWGVCTPAWPPPSSSHPALRARLSASASNIFAKLTQSLSSIICDFTKPFTDDTNHEKRGRETDHPEALVVNSENGENGKPQLSAGHPGAGAHPRPAEPGEHEQAGVGGD